MGAGFVNDYYIEMEFGQFRDYRIIKMADAQGNVREGIFLPFVQNGIKYDSMNPHKSPMLRLKPLTAPRGNLLSKLIPYANKEMRKKMIDAGVISPKDERIFNTVGYVKKDNEYMIHRGDARK